jgi:hypothetical protein
VEWFGTWTQIEIIANNGPIPLLGVGFLLGHELNVNYRTQVVTLLLANRSRAFAPGVACETASPAGRAAEVEKEVR